MLCITQTHYIFRTKKLSIDTMQLFLDSNDFDSELLKLKQRIKNILNECFIDIYLQCHYKTFDFFGNVLAPMEDEF